MTDPIIIAATEAHGVDRHDLEELFSEGAAWARTHVPVRFGTAVTDLPLIKQWVTEVVTRCLNDHRSRRPVVKTGPSLLLSGPTGTGKTWQGFGAMRALSAAGVVCRWRSITSGDLFARLRPRNGVDSEAEFEAFAGSPVLMVDDLGACKNSEWTEDVLYRLVNRRYNHVLPTLFTTNIAPAQFSESFGSRVASRLAEMSTLVPLTGPDRRMSMRGFTPPDSNPVGDREQIEEVPGLVDLSEGLNMTGCPPELRDQIFRDGGRAGQLNRRRPAVRHFTGDPDRRTVAQAELDAIRGRGEAS